MVLKRNAFTPAFEEFQEQLASYGHYQLFTQWQLKLARKSLQKSLTIVAEQGYPDQYGAGNCMTLMNIFHPGKFAIRTPFGKRFTQGKQLLPMVEEIDRRFNAFILVHVFEVLEAYLKSVYGTMLFYLRNEITISNKKAFHQGNSGWAKKEGTAPYYERYAQHSCKRDCTAALTAFSHQLNWGRVAYLCTIDMNIDDTVEALGYCRHCIIHNEGRLGEKRLNMPQQEFIKSCMHKGLHSSDEFILPPADVMKHVFEAAASYGWGLYVLLSERCSMRDDTPFFKPTDEGMKDVKPN